MVIVFWLAAALDASGQGSIARKMETGMRFANVFFATLFGLAFVECSSAHDLSRAQASPKNARPPETLQSIDLGKEIPNMSGRQMRMRRMTLDPGGAVPPHGHEDRPAVVYILQGRVREHRSDYDAPIEYGAGDSITEDAAVHHWIENIGDEPLVGVVVDITNDGSAQKFTAEEILKAYGRKAHRHDD